MYRGLRSIQLFHKYCVCTLKGHMYMYMYMYKLAHTLYMYMHMIVHVQTHTLYVYMYMTESHPRSR